MAATVQRVTAVHKRGVSPEDKIFYLHAAHVVCLQPGCMVVQKVSLGDRRHPELCVQKYQW